MSRAERRLAEDLALRDAALAVFRTDLRFIREDLSDRGVGERIADRLGDATMDMVDDAVDYAEENKGQVAAALAAAVLWFARAPILDGVARLLGVEEGDEDAEQAEGDARSPGD
jgi:hypothetical protein